MHRQNSNHQINKIVIQSGAKCMQYKQAASRLLDLLEKRLHLIEREYRRQTNPGRASIRALADARYVSHIDEIVEIKSVALEAHITWETHRMLIDARKSTASVVLTPSKHRK